MADPAFLKRIGLVALGCALTGVAFLLPEPLQALALSIGGLLAGKGGFKRPGD